MKKTFTLFVIVFLFNFSGKSQSLYFPPLLGNVWDSLSPSSVGYCQTRIDSLYNYLQAKNTKSFIILKDGKRVLEKYFGTYTKDSLWYWASASKSLASFITGVAQQKGFININNPVSSYIGSSWTSAPLIKENAITVKNLLQMTSGLDDAPPLPCDNEDTAKACLLYKADATTRWSYHTGAYRKVQDVVSTAVGQTYNTITNNWIEAKIGMSGLWFQQVYYSKARDMARFGLLNLNKGIWANDTIMKDSLYFKAMVNSSQILNNAYGYLWWLNGKSSYMTPGFQITFPGTLMPNAPSDMFCALGKNDQKIYVVPSQKLVVVRQGNTAGGFNLAASAFDNVLWDYINKLSCSTSIIENPNTTLITISPNPTFSNIKIQHNNSLIKLVNVYNMVGELVISSNESNKTIEVNLSKYSSGLYIVECRDEFNQVLRQKILKQ